MSKSNPSIIIGALFALIAVILGAFGAHALKDSLIHNDSTETWKTAVDYQMWHALALILCGLVSTGKRLSLVCVCCFTVGILLFSGSLYWLSLDGPRWLGPITPLGGISLITGWACLIIEALSKRSNKAHE
ncbi:MAG TPA: DUF423 domain-containing protein [Opitutae bacterium]|nr:DUF423 domain-containing protein [Opitutae bacterium]